MLTYLLSTFYLYIFLSLTIFIKILCLIFLYELYFLAILIDVLERVDEEYYRGDWLDDVVEDFLDEFEDDSLNGQFNTSY